MQTHKFKWKLFDVEYSSIKIWELEGEVRIDSEYYFYDVVKSINLIENKSFISLSDRNIEITWWNAFPSSWFNEKDWIPCARITEVNQNIIVNNWIKLEKNIFDKFDKKILKRYDILFWWTHHNAWDLWKVFLVNEENEITFNQRVFRLRSNTDKINQLYFYISLQTKDVRLQIEREWRWNNQLNLNIPEIWNIKIPIPSKSFQEKIQELVIKSYNQKELSEKLYKEAENLLLSELDLLDYRAKTKNINLVAWYSLEVLENHSVINYSILKELDRFDAEYWDYDFVEIKNRVKNIKSEKLWELVNYKKWIEVWSEAYIEESEVEITDDKKYFVRVSNFSTNWMTFNNAKYIKNDNFETLKDYQPQKWEILFSKDWTAWITYLLRENIDWIISGWILRFQNISHIPSEYIELVLNSILIQKEIERQTNWALIQHLKITDALNFDIPLIWDDKIEIITKKIQKSFEAKTKSKNLLEIAKKAVEIYIEEDESAWFEFIKNNV